jgi:hypothetical protein
VFLHELENPCHENSFFLRVFLRVLRAFAVSAMSGVNTRAIGDSHPPLDAREHIPCVDRGGVGATAAI